MAKLSFADLNRAGVFSGFTSTSDMSLKVEELEKNISAIKNNFSDRISNNEEKLNHLINTSKELLESNEKISVEIKEFRKSKKMIIILSSFALICVVISIILQLVK